MNQTANFARDPTLVETRARTQQEVHSVKPLDYEAEQIVKETRKPNANIFKTIFLRIFQNLSFVYFFSKVRNFQKILPIFVFY